MYDNMAILLPQDERKAIGAQIKDLFTGMIDKRRPRMLRIRDIYRHFSMEPKRKTFPFIHSANVQLPLMTAPVIQHQSRLFDMVYAGGGRLATIISPSYYQAAEKELAERYFNHYLMHEMPEFAMGLDASMFQMTLVGSSFRRTHWDMALGRCRSEWIPVEDFVAPSGWRSKDPSMRDVPQYSVITRKTLRQLRRNENYVDVDLLKPATLEEPEATTTMGEQSDRVDYGVDRPTADTQRIVLEFYFTYAAPRRQKKDERLDGREHPAYACVDYETGSLHSLVYREEDDPDDLERYASEFGQYQQAQRLYQQATTVAGAVAAQTGAKPPEIPEPDIEEPRMRKREVPLCTHYSAYPSEGFYGLGLGDFLLGPTKALNTIVNQSLDATTVRIARPGFMHKQLRGPRGGIATQPGHIMEVDVPMMTKLQDLFYFPDLPQGDPFVGVIANMIREMSQHVVGSFETMSGQIPGSNQAATSVTALIEQANMPITVMAKRARISLQHELEKVWRCLGTFLPDKKITDIIGADGQVQNVEVGAALFGPDSRIFPTADPRLRSERVSDAQNKLAAAMQNPLVQMGLQTGQPPALELVKKMSVNLFRALGDEQAAVLIEAIMPPGPPPGMGPPPGGPPGPGGPPPGPPPQMMPPPQNSTMPGGA